VAHDAVVGNASRTDPNAQSESGAAAPEARVPSQFLQTMASWQACNSGTKVRLASLSILLLLDSGVPSMQLGR
jgi:hypothetical protein